MATSAPSTTRRLDDIFPIAEAIQRAEPADRDAPARVRLEPNVTAALLPSLAGRVPPNVRLVQTAGGVDGYGNAIVEAEGRWPNAWRPSYRRRPVRMPHDLRLECDDTRVVDDLPRAIALLAPVTGVRLRVLIDDRRLVYPATVTVDRIRAVATERVWYPYGAGSFGAAIVEFLSRAIVNRLEDRGLVEFHDAEAAILVVTKAIEENFAELDALEQEARQRLGGRATGQQIESEMRRIAAERNVIL